ncbi:flagellar hook-length control protein FliK [Craterilacuibacter sp. RT1T]|uniref:flagellar hook-length control protein FliK n=1 Tax=Craterilacuibacter sp. RT1T TaxID=2942211 RepID=UPI0020BEBD16|nr:flagellar hook-length control protein FliK [Craterilacuibacter sp. RT1T]MCL6264689.1 flagellar hook-length control protein FliK [Craterilacuibacter sp. RT1T]
MAIPSLSPQAPARNAAFALPQAGELAASGDLFASLLGLQMGGKSVLAGVEPKLAGIKPDLDMKSGKEASTAEQPQLFLYGAQPAVLPMHILPSAPSEASVQGQAGDMLDLTQEMLAASHVAGGKKLPHETRQLLQFLPDGSQMAQSIRPADTAPAGQIVQLTVNTPLSPDKAWGEALAGQVSGLIQMKAEGATIKLNPAHLGPIEVALKLNQDQAQISFVTATPQARDALEQNLSRLTSMLAESGVQLTDAQVSYGGRQQQQEQQQARRGSGFAIDDAAAITSVVAEDADNAGLSIRA